jgi:hypothetical protein
MVPSVSGGEGSLEYGGDALEKGVYYQFRITAMRDGGAISTTEDLLGVFYLE